MYVDGYLETRWFYALFVKINLEYPITYAFLRIKEGKMTRMTFTFNASLLHEITHLWTSIKSKLKSLTKNKSSL